MEKTENCMDDEYSRPDGIEERVAVGIALAAGVLFGFGLAVAIGAITGVIG